MKKLVYEGHFIKGDELMVVAPFIAGFYGAYTGQKSG